MKIRLFVTLVFFIASLMAHGLDRDVAVTQIQTRPIAEISQLPKTMRDHLSKKDCQVPTGAIGKTTPKALASIKGWVKGSFAKKGQTDWAVICVKNKRSHIVVMWGGKAKCKKSKKFKAEAKNHVYGGSEIGRPFFYFSRDLSVSTSADTGHDSLVEINDKGAESHYCSNGLWVSKNLYH